MESELGCLFVEGISCLGQQQQQSLFELTYLPQTKKLQKLKEIIKSRLID